MEQTQSRRARFGPFELDLRAGELRGNGAPVLLPIQLLQVLRTLIERDGDLVSREELKKCLWPNDTTSYFDANLLLAQVSASAAGGEIVAVQNKETDRIELMTLDAGVASELKEVLSVHDTLAGFSWTPEGKILYARRNRMVVVDGNGSEENVFTSDPSMPVAWPDVCRDGKHVVFVWRFHDGTFSPAISRVDIDGSNPTQLTFAPVRVARQTARRLLSWTWFLSNSPCRSTVESLTISCTNTVSADCPGRPMASRSVW